MDFVEILNIDELHALTKKRQTEEALKLEKEQSVKKLSREELRNIKDEKMLRNFVEWRKERYTKQFWNKLNNASFIKLIAKKIKKAATEGKNSVYIPVIYMYWNKIDCRSSNQFNLCDHSVCDKVFSTYFPKAQFTPQINTYCADGSSYQVQSGYYLYDKLLISSASVLSQDEELLKNVKTHLAINGIPVSVQLYNWGDTVGLEFRW